MPANTIVLGAAWQLGAVPLTLDAIRRAFALNGVQVEMNLAAFEWGRAVVDRPNVVRAELTPPAAARTLSAEDRRLIDSVTSEKGTLNDLLAIRVPDLFAWGGARAAAEYCERLASVRAAEQIRIPRSTAVTEAVAVGLHKLMAYKDEYEVARLHLEQLAGLPTGSRVTFHLHPPLLRAMGLRRKIGLRRSARPTFAVLTAMRGLRGTRLDPFGYAHLRRVERELPREYLAIVSQAIDRLHPSTLDAVIEIAALPDLIRGYEEIKLAGVERFRGAAAELLAALV